MIIIRVITMSTSALKTWELLLTSADLGSVAAASEAMQIDNVTAGRLLTRLEKEIGRPLFVRRARPFRLTTAGELAAEKIRPILASYQEAMQSLSRDSAELQGRIRLSVAGGYAHEVLVPELMAFMESYPGIDFDVSIARTAKDVLRNNVDIALVSEAPSDPSLVAMWRDHSVFIPVASPAYIGRRGFPHSPEDLKSHFGFVYTGPVRTPAETLERNGKSAYIKWQKSLRIADIIAVKNAVLAGYGVAVDMPIVHCHREISDGRLIPVLDGWRVPTRDLYAVTTRANYAVKRIRTFMDWYVPRSVAAARLRDRRISEQLGLML